MGPIGEGPEELQSCYESSLNRMKENNLRTIVSYKYIKSYEKSQNINKQKQIHWKLQI